MASESGIIGRDPCWKYCTPMKGDKNGTVCNYCGLAIKSGGITRFKFHLSHIDPNSNTKKYPNMPLKVKQEIRRLLEQKNKAKAKKAVDIEECGPRISAQCVSHLMASSIFIFEKLIFID